ncbi:hypothetical protein Y032_0219g2493 [Ancylostoma ceylanicum]|uniref:C-type lectin domain-containing protein n=1 Tax=Ancylostoma ceylanicum TaxID=53326 RepID=A0A016SJQ5_9BILA|nr:hypothetical protein Y032_0219g2493 [Ancylostoma ceylanicum]
MQTFRYLCILLFAQVVLTDKADAKESGKPSAPKSKAKTASDKEMGAKEITYKRKDGAEVVHYIFDFEHIAWKKARSFCKERGLTLGSFKDGDEHTKVIEKYRQEYCQNCKWMVWVTAVGDKRRRKNQCVFLMLNDGTPGTRKCRDKIEGVICTKKEEKKTAVRYLLRRKRNQRKMIAYKRKDGSIVKHCIMESGPNVTWSIARSACCKFGYRLGTFADFREAKYVITKHRRRSCLDCDGFLWMAGDRNEEENTCPAATMLRPKKLIINCNHRPGEESKREIRGFVCSKIQKPKR